MAMENPPLYDFPFQSSKQQGRSSTATKLQDVHRQGRVNP
jgi:hypothetical protein